MAEWLHKKDLAEISRRIKRFDEPEKPGKSPDGRCHGIPFECSTLSGAEVIVNVIGTK
jgi:hypothetical protein